MIRTSLRIMRFQITNCNYNKLLQLYIDLQNIKRTTTKPTPIQRLKQKQQQQQ